MTISRSGFRNVHRNPSTEPRYRVLRSRQIRISRISRYAISSRSALVMPSRPPPRRYHTPPARDSADALRASGGAGDAGARGGRSAGRGGCPAQASVADQLDVDLAFPGAVELGEDDRLEASERELAVV